VIEVIDLHKNLGGRPVLAGVNLVCPAGRMTVLIGRSGAGKSVLLRHLMGLLRPDAGAVRVGGRDLAGLSARQLRELRAQLGVLFQGGALFDFMTVADNVAFPLRVKRALAPAEIRAEALRQLAAVGLAGDADKYPVELSGGMRKRAALARALAGAPSVVLFDEPSTGLDPILLGSIHRLIADSQARLGFTAVLVSHEIPEVLELADHVAMLEDGVIVEAGSPERLLTSSNPVVRRFLAGGDPRPPGPRRRLWQAALGGAAGTPDREGGPR
jgi:phospholipid/cholesterol/gamma-HCH transport system ATP-binding protein